VERHYEGPQDFMARRYQLETTFCGEPYFHRPLLGGTAYVIVDGSKYRVVQVLSPTKYLICKDGFFLCSEKLVLERCWGSWRVRERGWFE
jgi:hypothetical protein